MWVIFFISRFEVKDFVFGDREFYFSSGRFEINLRKKEEGGERRREFYLRLVFV